MRKNSAAKGVVMVICAGAALVLVLVVGYYALLAIGAVVSWCYHTLFLGPRVLVVVVVALLFAVPAAIGSASERIGIAWRDAQRRRARQRAGHGA